ncbi:LLM class flavin-dependent oxidoreductase [Streptomyces chartreusis]|uniref:LLM class flavin-dependent oxidoreductase n=1 Tax=Streptomyces chartreusis TaxID=1969 RepID=UPI00362E4D65
MAFKHRLSILDFAAIGPGVTAEQALTWTTDVAQAAESLGFHRFWVTEHHSVPDIGASAPAVLLAHLAANTARLRLGSGGVMLPNHPPIIVAEQFATLNALYPGRIDLGIGRARGADEAAARALGHEPNDREPARFAEQLDQLSGFLGDGFPEGHLFRNVQVSPRTDPLPIFLLGSSVDSARFAGERGLAFAFAHHLAPDLTSASLSAYRDAFRPSTALREPYAIATVQVVCARTQVNAERAAVRAAAIRFRRRLASRNGHSPTPAELMDPEFTADEAANITQGLSSESILIGTPESVRTGLESMHSTTGANELMLCTLEYEGPARIRTLECIMED